MKKLQTLLLKAENSKWHLFLLNTFLFRLIPFNKPHSIKILNINSQICKAELPYISTNLNHIGGLHACALATTAEFCAGIFLLRNIDSNRYRLIMKELKAEYFAQARSKAFATTNIDNAQMNIIKDNLLKDKVCEIPMCVNINDLEGKLLAKITVLWQMKDWEIVKMKK
jgi:hypothetical protein